jgi:hypothetical protein
LIDFGLSTSSGRCTQFGKQTNIGIPEFTNIKTHMKQPIHINAFKFKLRNCRMKTQVVYNLLGTKQIW